MKKLKRVICLLLVLIVGFTSLVGCKQESKEDQSNSKEVKNEAVTVKWVLYSDMKEDTSLVLDEFNKKLGEKIPNTKLEISAYVDNYADQIRTLIASGGEYDIMWASDWNGDYMEKINGGAFMPIKDLIDKNAPGLWNAIPEMAWPAGEVNGSLYGIPSYQQMYRGQSFGIPERFLKKNNFDIAKIEKMALSPEKSNIDIYKDIEPFLEWSKKNADIPATRPDEQFYAKTYERLLTVGDNIPGIGIKKYNDPSLKVYNMLDTKEFRDYIALSREWYKKGYYKKDILSAERLPANVLETVVSTEGLNIRKEGNTARSEIVIDPIMTKVKGEPMVQVLVAPYYLEAKAGSSTMNFINKKSKNPERAIKLLELINTDAEMYNLLCYGIDGVHFKKKADGGIEVLKESYGLWDWVVGNITLSYNNSKEANELVDKLNKESDQSPVRGFAINIEPIKNELAQIGSVLDEYYKPLLYGVLEDYDKKHEQLLSQLKTAGMDKVVNEIQNQVDDWAKKTGKK